MDFQGFRKAAEDSRVFFEKNADCLQLTEKTKEIVLEFPTDVSLLMEIYSGIMTGDGEIWDDDKDEKGSVEEFRTAITEMVELASEFAPTDADIQVQLGYHLYAFMDQTDQAIKQFESALAVSLGQQVEAFVGLSNCFLEKGRFEKNILHLEKARVYSQSALDIEEENEEALKLFEDIQEAIAQLERTGG
ncbi:MAG: hypothetical protein KC964_08310 [Candidatus Omnitrophica bacterium]|nr:hypothetical protein [Candidatus Omnitrophota bacterium]